MTKKTTRKKSRTHIGKVFISYSRTNTEVVGRVAKALQAWGYRIWMDQTGIPGGAEWREAIRDAIKESDAFVLMLSPKSSSSEVVLWELESAETAGIPIVPVRIGRGEFSTDMQERLKHRNWISLLNEKTRGMARLVEALGGIREDFPRIDGDDKYPGIGDNAHHIRESIRFAQEVSFQGGPVIYSGGREWEYYIQFYAMPGDTLVYGEAVGNDNLPKKKQLSEQQIEKLLTLGWQDPESRPKNQRSGNFWREWHVNSDRGRALIAGDIMRTFLEVYDHWKGEHLSVKWLID